MRPRLESQQLTIEDWEAWTLVQMRFSQVHHLQWISFRSDRRDAYLMLYLESQKANGCHVSLTKAGQLYGMIGSFVRVPSVELADWLRPWL